MSAKDIDLHGQARANDMKTRCKFICLKYEMFCRLSNAYFRVWQLRYLYTRRLNTYGAAGPPAMPAGGFTPAQQAVINANIDACVHPLDRTVPGVNHVVQPGLLEDVSIDACTHKMEKTQNQPGVMPKHQAFLFVMELFFHQSYCFQEMCLLRLAMLLRLRLCW